MEHEAFDKISCKREGNDSICKVYGERLFEVNQGMTNLAAPFPKVVEHARPQDLPNEQMCACAFEGENRCAIFT